MKGFAIKCQMLVFKEPLLITMFFMVPPPVSSGRAKRLRRPFYLCHIPMSVLLAG